MNVDSPTPMPNSEEDLDDDPYIHTVSREEFVETVEQASHEENDTELAPSREKPLVSPPRTL